MQEAIAGAAHKFADAAPGSSPMLRTSIAALFAAIASAQMGMDQVAVRIELAQTNTRHPNIRREPLPWPPADAQEAQASATE